MGMRGDGALCDYIAPYVGLTIYTHPVCVKGCVFYVIHLHFDLHVCLFEF